MAEFSFGVAVGDLVFERPSDRAHCSWAVFADDHCEWFVTKAAASAFIRQQEAEDECVATTPTKVIPLRETERLAFAAAAEYERAMSEGS